MSGFHQSTGDLVITLDANLQNPLEEIPRFVSTAEEGYDVVGTIQMDRQDSSLRKSSSCIIKMII